MDNITYIGLSRELALMRKLDSLANNVANANTLGYRSERMLFDTYMMKAGHDEKIAFSHDVATAIDSSVGSQRTTNRDLDVAINGSGFFKVQTPQGVRYTRSGNFLVNQEGFLATPQGYQVLDPNNQNIPFQENDANFTIAEDGLIKVGNDERGRIGIVRFDNDNLLQKAGHSLYRTDQPELPLEEAHIVQGVLEESNVVPVQEMTRVVETTRDVTSLSKLLQSVDEMQRNAIQKLAQ